MGVGWDRNCSLAILSIQICLVLSRGMKWSHAIARRFIPAPQVTRAGGIAVFHSAFFRPRTGRTERRFCCVNGFRIVFGGLKILMWEVYAAEQTEDIAGELPGQHVYANSRK